MEIMTSQIIDLVGVDEYLKHERKHFVILCKQRGLTIKKAHQCLNIFLKSQSQKPMSESYVRKVYASVKS